jgi:hypothetical protein|tara:strand:- start:185 stop:1216 length:1032 start_codon:yes stop_codon:yes gene_type:complete
MKKKIIDDEIDLTEIIEIIWRKKLSVIFIIVISLLVVFLDQSFNKERIKINARTEIRPIKTADEASYQIFNSVLRSLKPSQSLESNSTEYTDVEENKFFKTDEISVPNNDRMIKNLNIININKEYLYDLFIEIINEKSNLKSQIKKSSLVKKDNYLNIIEYENAVDKLVSSIRLIKFDDEDSNKSFRNKGANVRIEIVHYDVKQWEKFLNFLEVQTNLKIQAEITKVFNNYVSYLEIMREFEIQDLEAKMLTLTDNAKMLLLKKNIEILKADNYSGKILSMFKTSPISNQEEFYAARIISDSTIYKLDSIKTKQVIIYVSVIVISGIFGIFVVLIMNRIQRRR